jgi:amidohydrolase
MPPLPDTAHLKRVVCDSVDAFGPELLAASHDIWQRPELAYEEHYASKRLADLLRSHGLSVTHPAYGLDTAFVATIGAGSGPHIVICCEYDALPGIGHACGHNIIGTAGVGAGLAAALVVERLGGRLTILGTPAEEGGNGKGRLIDAGAFADIDVAMMVHPEPGNVEIAPYLATATLVVEMHGKAAHASSSASAGVNALDALVSGYQAMNALRGTLRADERVHGIITNGGDVENTVPEFASGRFRARARNLRRLQAIQAKLLACYEGAALQMGAKLEYRWENINADVVSNVSIAAAFRRNGESLGRVFIDPALIPVSAAGSTDMGNVSYVVPTIHPVIDVGRFCAGHTPEMAEASIAPGGDAAVIDGAKMLAMTAVDVWVDTTLLEAARAEFALIRR